MNIKLTLGAISIAAALTMVGCGSSSSSSSDAITTTQKSTALTAYADYALEKYTAARADALSLQTALTTFTGTPTAASFTAAKTAWITARESYGVTEILRLSDGPIDAESGYAATFGAPEGSLNAWPLDEAMVDTIVNKNGASPSDSIIESTGSMSTFTGQDGTANNLATATDVTSITKTVLAALNENGGDANVAAGYHAIEFLLWGQDQDYENGLTTDGITTGALVAGTRDFSDYTTASNFERRKEYVNAAAELILDDLDKMVTAWGTGGDTYRDAFLSTHTTTANNIDSATALKQIFVGMGTFVKSELANERIAVAALTPSEEDEHSCFSDNTHRDIILNYTGFTNILALFKSNLSTAEQATLTTQTDSIDAKMTILNTQATTVEHFDYQIRATSSNLSNVKAIKNELRDLGDEMVKVASEYGISITTTDVTDGDETSI